MTTSSPSEVQEQPPGRRVRLVQMLVVLGVGFVLPVTGSPLVFFGLRHTHPASQRGIMFMIVYQAIGLTCLYFVLRRQKRTLLDLGFFLAAPTYEIGHALAIFLGVLFLGVVTRLLVIPLIFLTLGHSQRSFDPAVAFGGHITIFTGVFVFLNAFHEELLVRAFLISELDDLYHRTWLAVGVSVALQTSYHLYQGLPAALAHIPTFLLFSVYYVRTRRIFPVILAHMFVDIMALALYAHMLHLGLHS